MRCPNGCGDRVQRKNLEKHLDSWHGTCNARLVRCPSNLVGFKVLVVYAKDDAAGMAAAQKAGVEAEEAEEAEARLALTTGGAAAAAAADVPLCGVVGTWKDGVDVGALALVDASAGVDGVLSDADSAPAPAKVKIGARRTKNDDGTVTDSTSGEAPKPKKAKTASDAIEANGDIGIVLRYSRDILPEPSRTGTYVCVYACLSVSLLCVLLTLTHTKPLSFSFSLSLSRTHTVSTLDGVDRLYVKFDNRHEWLDYWSQEVSIIPLKKVQGSAAASGHRHAEMKCQWIPFGQLNSHLNFDCSFRSVWLAGNSDRLVVGQNDAFHREDPNTPPKAKPLLLLANGETAPPRVDALKEVDTRLVGNKLVVMPELTGDTAFQGTFRGQQAQFVDSIKVATLRNEYDEFLVAPSTTTRCDFCALQFAHDKVERHQKYDCGKVLVRCKLGCGARLPRNELDEHAQKDCLKRPLTCEACGQEGLWVDEIQDHNENLCPVRVYVCMCMCMRLYLSFYPFFLSLTLSYLPHTHIYEYTGPHCGLQAKLWSAELVRQR